MGGRRAVAPVKPATGWGTTLWPRDVVVSWWFSRCLQVSWRLRGRHGGPGGNGGCGRVGRRGRHGRRGALSLFGSLHWQNYSLLRGSWVVISGVTVF